MISLRFTFRLVLAFEHVVYVKIHGAAVFNASPSHGDSFYCSDKINKIEQDKEFKKNHWWREISEL